MRVDPADDDAVRACHRVQAAAQAIDDPLRPPMSFGVFRVWVLHGWDSNPGELWFVPGAAPDEALAWYQLEFPDLENRDRGFLRPYVRPASRRRGIGRDLLRHAADRAAANGRTVFGGGAAQDSAGDAFARQVGATPGLVEAR
ncbi:GNAT family N-acetyltransferase, partial [Trebonia sp.]|uniref:GNAT family N-acetyltransferase n=1 Tax=Trebonia sp. TaxID=2767075 RepID=UPI002629368F